jgi:hypothetical protein
MANQAGDVHLFITFFDGELVSRFDEDEVEYKEMARKLTTMLNRYKARGKQTEIDNKFEKYQQETVALHLQVGKLYQKIVTLAKKGDILEQWKAKDEGEIEAQREAKLRKELEKLQEKKRKREMEAAKEAEEIYFLEKHLQKKRKS